MDDNSEATSVYDYRAQSADSRSSSVQANPKTRGRSRKRSISQDLNSSHSRVKRLKPLYNENYRILFNETVHELNFSDSSLDKELSSGQIGVTRWSSIEKEILFLSLSKHGRHNIQSIAADISSKSESEVYIYLDYLRQASMDQQGYESPKAWPRRHDFDATVEITQDCCDRLDSAAEALAVLQQKEEEKNEQKRHGDLSILTLPIAKRVHRQLRAGKGEEDELLKMVPAADLLNLKNFLTLSKRVFMNSSKMENNWRSYAEGRKSQVSIMYTAFSDFYTLAISIVKRLVQSTIFFAMSRLRAIDVPGRSSHGRHVRSLDIAAALNVLGMNANARMTWSKSARKCHLRVFEEVRHRKIYGRKLGFNEVEASLNPGQPTTRGRSLIRPTESPSTYTRTQIEGDEGPATERSESSTSPEPQVVTEEVDSSDSPDTGFDTMSETDDQVHKQQLLEAVNDEYAEARDQRASRKEEQRLWELLGEDPEEITKETDTTHLPRRPEAEPKDKDDFVDWRETVRLAQEWEMYGSPVPASSFITQREASFRRAAAISSENDTQSQHHALSVRRSRGNSLSNDSIRDGSSNEEQESAQESDGSQEGSASRSRSLRPRKPLSYNIPTVKISSDEEDVQSEDDGIDHEREGDAKSDQSKQTHPTEEQAKAISSNTDARKSADDSEDDGSASQFSEEHGHLQSTQIERDPSIVQIEDENDHPVRSQSSRLEQNVERGEGSDEAGVEQSEDDDVQSVRSPSQADSDLEMDDSEDESLASA